MKQQERGVLSDSKAFFFSPSKSFLRYNYGVINFGHFFCRYGYRKERKGNALPLLVHVINGEFCLDYKGEQYVGKTGDTLCINCTNPHAYFVEQPCEFFYFHFAGNRAFEVADSIIETNHHSPLFHLQNSNVIYKSMKDMISYLTYNQAVSDISLSCMVYQCLCILQAANDNFTIERPQPDDTVALTIAYIKNNLEKTFTLAELADHVNLSQYYLAHLFKKETGISPIEYVAISKVDYAKSILKTTTKSVVEIADMLGYSSTSSFINAFRKRTDTTPARFRKMG